MRSSCQRDETMEIVSSIGLGVGGRDEVMSLAQASMADSMIITAGEHNSEEIWDASC